MILYFSGTGNSKYVAKRIADALGDALVNLNDRIKASATLRPSKPASGLLSSRQLTLGAFRASCATGFGKRNCAARSRSWFVMTCGSEIGNADKYNRELCTEKAISCMGTAQIVMPENYIAMFSAPQADEARKIVAKAEPSIDRAIAAIQRNQSFAPTRNNLYDRFMSGPVNPIFYRFFVKANAFTVSDACISCGQCAKRCPMNNVTLKDGKPVWGKACTHCMACICYCPVSAIEYGKKSVGQPRYHFEAL